MTLGEKIKSLREENEFRIQDFAVALVTSPKVVTRLENNEFKFIRQRWIQVIASLTGMETSELTKGLVHYYDPARQEYVLRDEHVTQA